MCTVREAALNYVVLLSQRPLAGCTAELMDRVIVKLREFSGTELTPLISDRQRRRQVTQVLA
ncbi:MAG: hypothetical protein ABGZ35_08230 [Planctomycetaceae bacterium]